MGGVLGRRYGNGGQKAKRMKLGPAAYVDYVSRRLVVVPTTLFRKQKARPANAIRIDSPGISARSPPWEFF
jgi:hypothetical protein